MAESGQTPNRGLSATIESIVSKMGALLLNRVELFLLEARSAKQKVWTGLVLTVLGIFSVFMAMLFTLIMIILLAPESWRAGLLGGVTGCFLLFALIAFWLVKRSIQNLLFGLLTSFLPWLTYQIFFFHRILPHYYSKLKVWGVQVPVMKRC